MEKEPLKDDFYSSGPSIIATTKPRKRRRRPEPSNENFDETKGRVPRSNNQGISRLVRKIRRHEEFRMKLLWFTVILVIASIMIYALSDYFKWERVEGMSKEQQRAELSDYLEKNRQK